jgi:hypothetical protein
MKTALLAVCVLVLTLAARGQDVGKSPVSAPAQTPSPLSEKPTVPTLPDVNPEMLQAVIADQWDRGMDMFSGRPARNATAPDWNAIAARDKKRQATVRALAKKGELKSGRDYQFAALVFQHSESPADVRLAHVFAVTAALKGQPQAKWLAAAALDRYLWDTNQPQVFGTQFKQMGDSGAWTMDPYDREDISDSVRAEWCVVSLSEQARVLAALKDGQSAGATSTPECK